MRFPDRPIHALVVTRACPAFHLMQMLYESFKDPRLRFWDDFADYALNGYIRISPTAMAFAKPCRDEEGDYWFIRAAVGPLAEVMTMLPYFLPRIMWMRDNSGILHMWKTERLIKLVERGEQCIKSHAD